MLCKEKCRAVQYSIAMQYRYRSAMQYRAVHMVQYSNFACGFNTMLTLLCGVIYCVLLIVILL